MENIIKNIEKVATLTSKRRQRDNLYFVTTNKEQALPLITYLRDFEGFSHFVMLSVADWIEENEFELMYLLNNPSKKVDIGVCVRISRTNATMYSAHHLWEQIWTYQRELKEMYGIDFPGSPRVDENFMLEGWDDIPPMRREFDTLKYANETYFPRPGRETHDPATYMKQKLYPNE